MSTLTDTTIRATSATSKPVKLSDGDGLHLLVKPNGSKLWRFRYHHNGTEKMIGLGKYPETSLKLARGKRDDARRALAAGSDPSAERRADRAASTNTFAAVGREYLDEQSKVLDPKTLAKLSWFFDKFLMPAIGAKPIADVKAPDLLAALRRAEGRGLTYTVQGAKMLAGRIFRYGIATGRCEYDIAAGLKGAIVTHAARHFSAITDPVKVGDLLRAIDGYQGQPSTVYALRLLPLVALRSNELRNADWSEIDFEARLWRVPASRMKGRRNTNQDHLVPLSDQAVRALTELQGISGSSGKIFASWVPGKVISENTLNHALRRLGFTQEEQTTHGFRTIFSTLQHEMGVDSALIELQLAHRDRNSVRAAYNRAERLEERRAMMQRWADHLDTLRAARS